VTRCGEAIVALRSTKERNVMTDDAGGRATVPCLFCEKWNRVDMARVRDRPKCGQCGRPMLLDRPVRLTDETLARVVSESAVPVLVDFYADWCGPCKVMAPVLDDIAHDRAGQALVGKLDTDRNPVTTRSYSIGGIPTLILFHGGREVARETGAVPRPRVEALLDRADVGRAADS
jgi:thioredoxin 2